MEALFQYLEELPEAQKGAFLELRDVILANLPKGFQEVMSYGMVSYVVPHDVYPKGYHCNPKDPLPFMGIACRKNYTTVHHLGLYVSPALMDWLKAEYSKHADNSLDVGKGCIRFKKTQSIPLELIAELSRKLSVEAWIQLYESTFKR